MTRRHDESWLAPACVARAALAKTPPSPTWTLQGTPPAHPVLLAEVATKKGFDLVVDRSSAVVQSDVFDITDDVIRAYDWSTP